MTEATATDTAATREAGGAAEEAGEGAWYAPRPMPPGGHWLWTLGPLRLSIAALPQEWQVGASWDPSSPQHPRVSEVDEAALPPLIQRFGFQEAPAEVTVAPALADRPVIIRPETEFTLLPGEEVRAYVSTPLWVRVMAGSRQVLELPSHRPSDTWFGPHTREGVMAYAGSTRLRLSFEPAEVPPARVVTPLVLRNAADAALSLQRVRLPLRHLSLYASEGAGLFTERVTLVLRGTGSDDQADADQGPPMEAAGAQLLLPPREPAGHSFSLRLFEGVFR